MIILLLTPDSERTTDLWEPVRFRTAPANLGQLWDSEEPLNRKKHIGLVERRTGHKSAISSRIGRSDWFRRTNLDAHVPLSLPRSIPSWHCGTNETFHDRTTSGFSLRAAATAEEPELCVRYCAYPRARHWSQHCHLQYDQHDPSAAASL